jgi:hypothetical protein
VLDLKEFAMHRESAAIEANLTPIRSGLNVRERELDEAPLAVEADAYLRRERLAFPFRDCVRRRWNAACGENRDGQRGSDHVLHPAPP